MNETTGIVILIAVIIIGVIIYFLAICIERRRRNIVMTEDETKLKSSSAQTELESDQISSPNVPFADESHQEFGKKESSDKQALNPGIKRYMDMKVKMGQWGRHQ